MMHQHQLDYLAAELRKHADAAKAYAELARPPKSFLAVSFMRQSKFDRINPKLRRGMVAVSDEYADKFPGGVPGMPNLIRRDEFDAAWSQR